MPDPVLAWCDDIHSVRGNVSQLQATLNQLITKTPAVAQYRDLISTYGSPEADKTTEAPHILEKLRSIMHSPQVKVAVRLKSLYDRGYLPFLLGLSRINFRSPKCDRFVGYLLDFCPPKVNGSSMFPEEGAFVKQANLDPEESMYPPSLPPIENESLLKLILTDKSLRQPSDFLESEFSEGFHDYNNNHNRKLSLRGSGILDIALTDILDEAFPKVHEDDLIFLKHRFSSTAILAKLAFCYNISDSVMHHMSQEASIDDKLIVLKNVFLAYIGGMSKSEYTFAAIRLWIGQLYQPLIAKLQKDSSQSQLKSVYSLAFAELNFMLRRVNNLAEDPTKRLKYDFRMVDNGEPFVYQLHVANTPLGIGTASSIDKAKQKAAYETFETPELRTQLMNILVTQFRTPVKEIEIAPTKIITPVAKEVASEDETYSPELSGDEYEPDLPDKGSEENTGAAETASPSINYSDWPPKSSNEKQQTVTDTLGNTGQQTVAARANKPQKKHQPHHSHPPTHTQQQANTQPAPPQVRMPLPYGKLPPIPNMKGKGGKF
ncbi:hypothetical protein OXX79_001750 [Metschnikowia pulcherrima]